MRNKWKEPSDKQLVVGIFMDIPVCMCATKISVVRGTKSSNSPPWKMSGGKQVLGRTHGNLMDLKQGRKGYTEPEAQGKQKNCFVPKN